MLKKQRSASSTIRRVREMIWAHPDKDAVTVRENDHEIILGYQTSEFRFEKVYPKYLFERIELNELSKHIETIKEKLSQVSLWNGIRSRSEVCLLQVRHGLWRRELSLAEVAQGDGLPGRQAERKGRMAQGCAEMRGGIFTDRKNRITRYRFIHFVLGSRITPFWMIRNNKTGHQLGRVSYYRTWNQWVVQFEPDAVFAADCLEDIRHFLKNLIENKDL